MTTLPFPDNNAALEFLRKVYPDGPWVLTAIRPDRKAIDTRTFHPATQNKCLEWLAGFNGERNIYWSVNPPLRDLDKKAEREDIKEVCYLHASISTRGQVKIYNRSAVDARLSLAINSPAEFRLPQQLSSLEAAIKAFGSWTTPYLSTATSSWRTPSATRNS